MAGTDRAGNAIDGLLGLFSSFISCLFNFIGVGFLLLLFPLQNGLLMRIDDDMMPFETDQALEGEADDYHYELALDPVAAAAFKEAGGAEGWIDFSLVFFYLYKMKCF